MQWDFLLFSILRSVVAFLAVLCFMRIFELTVLRWIWHLVCKLHRNLFRSLVKALQGGWLFLSFLLSFYVVFYISPLSRIVQEKLEVAFLILFVFYFVWTIHRLIGYQTESLIADRKEKRRSVTSLKFFNRIFDVVLWIAALLFIISALDYDITVLLAGLGVGGVLFAVASQQILAELFSSFALYSDHIFEEGDFIIVGDFRGNPGHARGRIERIGLRSTHLRAPNGESIILPNQELASKIIYNYSKKKETKMSLVFSVDYGAEPEQLARLDGLVEDILRGQDLVRSGRLNFQEFGSSGLVFELCYELETADYDKMQEIHCRVGITLKEKLAENGIKLAGS